MQLMVRAGGRCEFPGCNKLLWRDGLTFQEINISYVAHIVAASPNGPRGDPVLSPKLAAEISNLMLLCADHHKLVDDQFTEYPVELLRRYKEEHEMRIELLTGLDESLKTHLLFFTGPIGSDTPSIDFKEAAMAVLPRYPAEPGAIKIDLTTSSSRDHEPDYFPKMQEEVSRQVQYHVKDRIGPVNIGHLSVFALASIPLLIHFGREIGDLRPMELYDYHRETGSWKWQQQPEENSEYIVKEPDLTAEAVHGNVVINLSLSGSIRPEEIARVMTKPYNCYTMTVPNPYPGFLKSKEQLDLFRAEMRALLSRIRRVHGPDCEVHLFPAIPASAAVMLGRLLLPKADPPMHIYEQNREQGGFRFALTVPRNADG